MHHLLCVVWTLLAIGVSIACFQYTDPAYVYIALTLALYALGLMPLYKANWLRSAAMTLFSLLLLVGIVEYYVYTIHKTTPPRRYEAEHAQHTVPDPVLGYALNPNLPSYRCTLRRTDAKTDTLVYDIVYTRGKEGGRITPEAPDATQGVFFFGCSFTQGEAVGDTESLPYQTALLLGKNFQVYNFGQGGYGPHQFLAELESDRKAELFKKYSKIHIIFLNINGHEFRSAGLSDWDTNGPRYVLEDGTLVRRGVFSDKTPFQNAVDIALGKSYTWQKVKKSGQLPNQNSMMTLQNAILLQARARVLQKYPHATFTILTYPGAEKSAQRLADSGVPTVYLGDFLPNWNNNKDHYQIPVDRHPNPLAYTSIAKGLTPLLLQKAADTPK